MCSIINNSNAWLFYEEKPVQIVIVLKKLSWEKLFQALFIKAINRSIVTW